MVIGSKRIKIPASGKMLGDYAEGDIVLLNESGNPVEFYVAKHDYESGLNGSGRTLLVRKDCYDKRRWHSSQVNAYATSNIDTWLNGDYKSLLDAAVQKAIETTTFYYTPGKGSNSVTTLNRDVFFLSVAELAKSASGANNEGSALPIADVLQIAYIGGSAVDQWTRTPYISSTQYVFRLDASGTAYNTGVLGTSIGSRPCFTLPSTALFDPETLLFKEVA